MTNKKEKIIRQPAVAGQFYPADKEELSNMIDEFLAAATTTAITGEPQILIVPHAGYVFSGATAAYAFKAVADKSFDTVIILGSSHNYPTEKLVLYNGNAVVTPLGEISVNQKINAELKNSNPNIYFDNQVHEPEHSLEVELPFLQKTLAPNWQVVLGLINNDNLETLKSVVNSLSEIIQQNPRTLIVISSDLSHYPNYDDAVYSDNKIITSILTKDIDDLEKNISQIMAENRPNLATCACGETAIKIGMLLADKLDLTGQILKYQNSGDTKYGDPPAIASREALRAGKNRVVGYGAIAFMSSPYEGEVPNASEAEGYDDNFLTAEEQKAALQLARNTLNFAFFNSAPKNEDYKKYQIFSEKRGVFVTLKKGEELRGCIGLIEPIQQLSTAIVEMTKAAAFDDPRFLPVTEKEFKDLTIEISVLTPPKKISDPKTEIELGRHGVIVKKGFQSGVFLPQVAMETGWDLKTFMNELCTQKAGLSPTCWTDGTAEIYTFEAQVFEEK
ncbi:MAG TPA: AmmeMemoRadiSam system protein B [bacterium]|nr:AmmeMemoRadiSam system protein B [bacterium]